MDRRGGNVNYGKFFIAMIACAAIMLAVHTVVSIMEMKSGIEIQIITIVFDLLIGAIFAYAFYLTKGIHGKDTNKAGLNYGLFLFALATVPSTLSMFLMFPVSLQMLFSWLAQGLVIALACGLAISHIEAR